MCQDVSDAIGLIFCVPQGVGSLPTVCPLYSLYCHNRGRLRGLAVACWTTDHYHPCSNLGVGISEGCFVLDIASLHLEVARPL